MNGLGFKLGLRKRGDRWGRIETIETPNSPPSLSSSSADTNNNQAESLNRQPELQSELSSINNNSSNNNSSGSIKLKSELVYMCYSMYTPWVKDAVYNVHKAASQYDRLKVRQRANK